jgi:ligand-binding sensor domain-containing protein
MSAVLRRGGWLSSSLYFLAGFGLMIGIGWLGIRLWPRPALPHGWLIVQPPQDVMALVTYDDVLWSGGRDGLYRIDMQNSVVIEKLQIPLRFSGVTSMTVDPVEKVLWVGHSAGVSRFDGHGWQTFTRSDGLPDDQVLALALTDTGELLVGTPHGLARRNDGNWQVFNVDDGLASQAVSVIEQDHQGRLWLGDGFTASGGLTMYDGNWHRIDPRGSLAHPVVNAIMQDRLGHLWFGVGFSSQGGATRYNGQEWTSFGVQDGLAGAKTRSLFEDNIGGLWFGSEYDGIARFDGNNWLVLTPEDGLAGWEVKAMLQDPLGNLWLGTENGLTRLDAQAWHDLVDGQSQAGD